MSLKKYIDKEKGTGSVMTSKAIQPSPNTTPTPTNTQNEHHHKSKLASGS
jgi:hypothetical protein